MNLIFFMVQNKILMKTYEGSLFAVFSKVCSHVTFFFAHSNGKTSASCFLTMTLTPYFYIFLYFAVIYSISFKVPCNLYIVWLEFVKVSLNLTNFVCASNISRDNAM